MKTAGLRKIRASLEIISAAAHRRRLGDPGSSGECFALQLNQCAPNETCFRLRMSLARDKSATQDVTAC